MFFTPRSTRTKAFTLLELIVVIVILGILALLAIPTFQKVIAKVRENSLKRSAESVGRNAVALAAFEDKAVTGQNITDAKSEISSDYVLGGVAADLTLADNSFTLAKGDLVATVTINGSVVTATTP